MRNLWLDETYLAGWGLGFILSLKFADASLLSLKASEGLEKNLSFAPAFFATALGGEGLACYIGFLLSFPIFSWFFCSFRGLELLMLPFYFSLQL